MIWESAYWKHDLLRLSRILKQKRNQKIWRESSMALIEKTVMIGFYIVRKLIDARKLSDVIVHQRIPVRSHLHRGELVTLRNWHHIDKHYDLDNNHQTQRTLIWLCNQIIHSYVFIVSENNDGGLDGFFFASDKERNKAVYYLSIKEVIKILETVGTNYPHDSHFTLNSETQDYDVRQE
jgi:hypothetical protein